MIIIDIQIVFGKNITVFILLVLNSFIKNLSMTKSRDLKSEIFKGQAFTDITKQAHIYYIIYYVADFTNVLWL